LVCIAINEVPSSPMLRVGHTFQYLSRPPRSSWSLGQGEQLLPCCSRCSRCSRCRTCRSHEAATRHARDGQPRNNHATRSSLILQSPGLKRQTGAQPGLRKSGLGTNSKCLTRTWPKDWCVTRTWLNLSGKEMRNPDFPAMAKSGLRTYKQVPNPDFTPRSPG